MLHACMAPWDIALFPFKFAYLLTEDSLQEMQMF